jgi:hypothetical protein
MEAAYSALNTRIDALTSVVRENQGQISHRLDSLSDEIRRLGTAKTPWGVLAGWATVVLAVVALAGSGYIRDMGRLEKNLNRIDQTAMQVLLENHTVKSELKSDIATISERFREVETQFAGLSRRIEDQEQWLDGWYATVPAMDSRQSERIRHLELHEYGQAEVPDISAAKRSER